MISIENFQLLIEILLIEPLHLHSWAFVPRYSTKTKDFTTFRSKFNHAEYGGSTNGKCLWWHEEPINRSDFDELHYTFSTYHGTGMSPVDSGPESTYLISADVHFHLFINSEKSKLKKELLKNWKLYDWYFFFHGFAALSWYSELKYFSLKKNKFDKVFICLNHNVTQKRSYRLHLLSLLKSNGLDQFGYISCPLLSQHLIKSEVFDQNSLLSKEAKIHVFNNLYHAAQPMLLDECDYNNASAYTGDVLNAEGSDYHINSFWHIITETVFYEEKLHLTEKIFKPIALQRPFMLVGAVGNLQYLKDYGFQTFDQWIDESYDNELDPDIRLEKIVHEIKKLCELSPNELQQMYNEMQEVLTFNHNHFYTTFRDLIVDELVDNFEGCVKQYNLGLSDRFRLPAENINFDAVKEILKR